MKINALLIITMTILCMPAFVASNTTRSIQYYLDNQPEKLNRNPNQPTWLRLAHLDLGNLEGLKNIADKETIQVLSFHDNKLKRIPAAAFKDFANAQTIALNKNQIETIDPHAFAGLNELRALYLNENPLKQFNPNILSNLRNLHDLELSNAQLTELDPFFPELPNLTILYLNNNKLSHINPKVFAKLPNLKWLYLNENPIASPENQAYQKALRNALPNVTIKF